MIDILVYVIIAAVFVAILYYLITRRSPKHRRTRRRLINSERPYGMYSYLISVVVTLIVFWYFVNSLPASIQFVLVLAIIFVVIRFGFSLYDKIEFGMRGEFDGDFETHSVDYVDMATPSSSQSSEIGENISYSMAQDSNVHHSNPKVEILS